MHKYNIRLILAAVLLVISLAALVWGLLPGERTVVHQTIQPTEMHLPTPQGFLPAQHGLDSVTMIRARLGEDRHELV